MTTLSVLHFKVGVVFLWALMALNTHAQEKTSLPSDAALQKEVQIQLQRANGAIEKAITQSKVSTQAAPKIESKLPSAKYVDPAEIAKRYEDINKASNDDLYIMVSFSMPTESLLRLADMASRADVNLVLRGVVDDSLPKTLEHVAVLAKKYPSLKISIDPTMFRRFGVQNVPTFIMTKDTIDEKQCSKACDPEDKYLSVAGDVSLDYALDYFAKHADKSFALQAEKYLRRIRTSP